jgi:hypothetical protein
MGVQALCLLASLNAECDSVDQFADVTRTAFQQHPDR